MNQPNKNIGNYLLILFVSQCIIHTLKKKFDCNILQYVKYNQNDT